MRTMHRIVLFGSEDPDELRAPDVGVGAATAESISREPDSAASGPPQLGLI